MRLKRLSVLPAMELFALQASVTHLELALAKAVGATRLDLLVPLAWHLRQRDCKRALQLAEEAHRLLAANGLPHPNEPGIHSRLDLVHAEVQWLRGDLAGAERLANQALESFEATGDPCGQGDACWLLASVSQDRGDRKQRDSLLTAACGCYQQAQEPIRYQATAARLIERLAFSDANLAARRLAEEFDLAQVYNETVTALLASARALVAGQTGALGQAISFFMQAREAAQATGQVRQAIVTTCNGADTFAALGDLDSALELDEQAVLLARQTGWPGMRGFSLLQTGNVLRLLKRHGDAKAAFDEALQAMAATPESQSYALVLQYLGELHLDTHDYSQALDYFVQGEACGKRLEEPFLIFRCWSGQAHALTFLNRPVDARERVMDALALAQKAGAADEQVKILRVIARLHRAHPLPPHADLAQPSVGLHYLHLALQVAQSIEGYAVDGELLNELATAHAESGDFQQAYAYEKAASEAWHAKRLEDARSRAIAMQLRQETQRALAEAEQNRQIAIAEASRAETLRQTSATLETLGRIGLELTASLDTQSVCQSLYRHANEMLAVDAFDIYFLNTNGTGLQGVFAMENDKPHLLVQYSLDDPNAYATRCARERTELVLDLEPGSHLLNTIAGTQEMLSLMFAPLIVGERLLGVISIRSARAHAYGEREKSIFHALCAYGAIALDNANAYATAESERQLATQAHQLADQALRDLQRMQDQLVRAEKLSALGALVAGIAHELNTPIGNSLMAASILQDHAAQFRATVAQKLTRSQLDDYVNRTEQGAGILQRSLEQAARLVSSFKQVAVDQTSEHRRVFELKETLDEILLTIGPSLRKSSHSVACDVPDGLTLDSYPGPLGQVITNLVQNCLLHAFEGRNAGTICIKARMAQPGWVEMNVCDDGVGIPGGHVAKVFDPFFTTKMGKGGSGLGLNVSYNIVTSILGGQLSVQSQPGMGSTFTMTLPLLAAR